MTERSTHKQAPPQDTRNTGGSDVKLAGRRRLIKLGAGALPVSLTLAARPVHAFQCTSTSAWGSQTLSASSLSHGPRGTVSAKYTLLQWKETSATAVAWSALATTFGLGSAANALMKATVQTLVDAGWAPLHVDTTTKLTAIFADDGNSHLQYLAAAMANHSIFTTMTGYQNTCLSNPVTALNEMAMGTFPPAPATVWTNFEVSTYLRINIVDAV